MSPVISIIIPTFNSSNTISRAIDSVLSQTYKNLELIIIDGNSSDNTVAIVNQYNDPKINVLSEPDSGVYDAMNKGVNLASGEWLYFLGSDDWIFDNHVFEKIFSNNSISLYDVVYGDVDAKHLSNIQKGEWTYNTLHFNRCHQCIFYKKRSVQKVGIYKLKYRYWSDFDLNLRLLASGAKFKYIDLIIAHFSQGGISDGNFDNFIHFYWFILIHFWNKLDFTTKKYYIRSIIHLLFPSCLLS